jgi:hypothetical protein
MTDRIKATKVCDDMMNEFEAATLSHGKFPSGFHGYAVIKEELEELWDAIKSKDLTIEQVRYEAIQIGAMSIRFVVDLCD